MESRGKKKNPTLIYHCYNCLLVRALYCLTNGETEVRFWGTRYFAMAPNHLHGVAPILEGAELRQGGEPQATQASHIPTLAEAQRQEQTRSTRARLHGIKAQGWRPLSGRRRHSFGAILTSCPHARSTVCLGAPKRGL